MDVSRDPFSCLNLLHDDGFKMAAENSKVQQKNSVLYQP